MRAHLDAIDARMRTIEAWGFENASSIYGPDELPQTTAPSINYLFGEVRRRWPRSKRMAVINWPVQHYYDLGLISKLPPRLE